MKIETEVCKAKHIKIMKKKKLENKSSKNNMKKNR